MLRTRYIPYGSRIAPVVQHYGRPRGDDNSAETNQNEKSEPETVLSRLLDNLATFQVSHGFFLHFYIVSVVSSGFWAFQLLTKGSAFRAIAQYSAPVDDVECMTIDQIALTWALMTFQGIRRLVESLVLTKPSVSRMWIAHWLLGAAFYVAIGVATWIEGAPTLLRSPSVYFSVTRSASSLKTMIGIPIFLLASGVQHDCHGYLASLPKYTLPMHPMFQVVVCPHYFTECLIYLSLAIIGAPRGAILNKTMFSAFIFVTTNLAVTASTTKDWYEGKFGKEAVAERWKMIPWLY